MKNEYCQCDFSMTFRDDNDNPYCSGCKKYYEEMENQPTSKTAEGILRKWKDQKTEDEFLCLTFARGKYAMEEYADLKVKEFKEQLLSDLPSEERIKEISQKYLDPECLALGMIKMKHFIELKLKQNG